MGSIKARTVSKNEAFYVLTGEPDALQIDKRCFRLEAGFLAQQQQKLGGFMTECFEEKLVKKNTVQFHVKWDLKEKVTPR